MDNLQHPDFNELPKSYALALTNISAISVSGEEADKYLQGQLTCDVEQLADKKLLSGSHCDAKGKVFSAFRLINHNDRRLLIQSTGSLNASMAELTKFGVFAKVDIEQALDLGFLALVGPEAEQFILDNFNAIPDSFNPMVSHQGTSIIYVGGKTTRYLLVAAKSEIQQITDSLSIPVLNEDIWALHEILSGFVHMSESAVNEYVPQMLNIHLINGVSFTKGCYLGQETVARMKYLGKNKRAMYALSGEGKMTLREAIKDNNATLELKLGDNWRRAGNIIAHYQADNGKTYLQAVLANDLDADTVFRIKDHAEVEFTLMTLPYSLTSDED